MYYDWMLFTLHNDRSRFNGLVNIEELYVEVVCVNMVDILDTV